MSRAEADFASDCTLHGDGMGIGTTEWQLFAELDTWLHVETSIKTPHFHVTNIKCVAVNTILGKGAKSFLAY